MAHTISQNGISEQDILIHYSNNSKLLPEEWTIVFMQSTSLQSAIVTLDTFYPPVTDLSQELINEMTRKGQVQNNSEKTKLARVTSLLRTLDTWMRLFHDSVEDMTRSEALICIFHLQASGENKAELVEETVKFERAKQRGIKYTTSLKSYLLRHRLVLTDILAAVKSIGGLDPPNKRSASNRLKRGDKKNGKEAAEKEKENEKEKGKEKNNEEPKNKGGGGKKVKCDLCGKNHANYLCKEELPKIASGEKKLASHICPKCLHRKDSKNHDSNTCYLARTFKNGVFLRTSWLCSTCNSIHFKICNHGTGPSSTVDEDQSKKVVVRSTACRMTRLQREDGDEEQSDREVQLQQERNDDQGVRLPEDQREDREGQEDGEGSHHSLPQRGLLQGQDDEESEESDQDFSDQDSLSDEDDEEQPRQDFEQSEVEKNENRVCKYKWDLVNNYKNVEMINR